MDMTNESIHRALDAELLRGGASADAYEIEAEIIGDRLRSNDRPSSEAEVTAIVGAVCIRIAGAGDARAARAAYARVARRICQSPSAA